MDMPEAEETIIEIRGLRTQFGRTVIHDDIDLDVRRGEVLGVVGASGSGKSVLLREIIGLLSPSAGEIRVCGYRIDRLSAAERIYLQRQWGVLFQDGALFSSLTVGENIGLPLREHTSLDEALITGVIRTKTIMVGLPVDTTAKAPAELSGGMRKRAGLARALALDPQILFLDEPTAGLDPIGAAEFDQLLVDLQRNLGLTVFMVTHDLDTLVATCDRIAAIVENRIILGTMDELAAHDHPWLRDYFHGPRARAVGGGEGGEGER